MSGVQFAIVDVAVSAGNRFSAGRERQMVARFQSVKSRGALRYYVKGKLLPAFLANIAAAHFSGVRPVSIRAFEASVTRVALATIDFKGGWTRHWLDPLEKL